MSDLEPPGLFSSDVRAARIYGFVAKETCKAVLLRRGPSKQVRLLSWDLKSDTIEAGQWFKGRIYERRCDLSPDGNLFAYFAAKHRGPVYSWTAVCRPPVLTAISFFPKGDCWGGGGLFADGKTLRLNHQVDASEVVGNGSLPRAGKTRKVPRYMRIATLRPWELPGEPQTTQNSSKARNSLNLRILPLGEHSGCGEDNPIEDMRLRRDGWAFADVKSTVTRNSRTKSGECSYVFDPPAQRWKAIANGAGRLQISLLGMHETQGRWLVETMQIVHQTGETTDFGRVDWADTDHNGDILYTSGGCVYRLKVGATKAELVADLNAMTFEAIRPGAISMRMNGT